MSATADGKIVDVMNAFRAGAEDAEGDHAGGERVAALEQLAPRARPRPPRRSAGARPLPAAQCGRPRTFWALWLRILSTSPGGRPHSRM